MAKRKTRRLVSYWVACDCRECLTETGGGFMFLSFSHATEEEAREDLKRGKHYHHDSLFVAKEVTEAVDPLPKRKPTRKAA